MAFLLPVGEIIMEAFAGGVVGNLANEAMNQFKPIVARKIGSEVADYAKTHPKGFLAQSLDSATKTRYQAISQAQADKAKDKAKAKRLEEITTKRKRYENDYNHHHTQRQVYYKYRH